MKCMRCEAETPNTWPHGPGGLCNGTPLVSGTPEYEEALQACIARAEGADAVIRTAHAALNAALIEGIYNGLPLGLVVVAPVPGDTVTRQDTNEVGKVVESGQITVAFHSGMVQLWESSTRDGLVLNNGFSERDGYALWLDTPKNSPGDRSWTIDHRDRRTPQVVAVDVVTTVTIRGAS